MAALFQKTAMVLFFVLAVGGGGLQAQAPRAAGSAPKTARPQIAPIRSVAFSPDGKSLLAAGGPRERAGQIALWDIAARKPVWQAPLPRGAYSAAFAPDGKALAVAFLQPDVQLLDAATGKPRLTVKGPVKGVWPVAFSADGKTLAGGGMDGTITLWDVADGKPRRTIHAHQGQVYSVALSPDGKTLLSGGEDYMARLWNVATGKQERAMPRSRSIVRSVCFSPDGRWMVTGSWDGSLRIYDAASGRLHAKIESNTVDCVAFASDGRHLAACGLESPYVEVYRLDLRDPSAEESQRIEKLLASLNDDSYAVREKASDELRGLGLVAVPELDKATGSPSAEVRVRSRAVLADVRSPEPWIVLKGRGEILAAAFSPDGKTIAAGGRDGSVQLRGVASRHVVATLGQ
jgi:WD40 repeat protein